MSKYIVRDVVCDWGICSVDDLGKEELVEVCNSKANAELICEILNTDLMKDGKYTVWKDKKISDLEAKLAESETKCYTLESYNNFLLDQCKKLIKENKKLTHQHEDKGE